VRVSVGRNQIREGVALILIASALLLGPGIVLTGSAVAVDNPDSSACAADHWVASWAASPTDSLTPIDAALLPVPPELADQTMRMIITPHLGGSELRIHLSNRFGSSVSTFGDVTVGVQASGATTKDIEQVTFGGKPLVSITPGQDVVSDPVALTFTAFTPLAVSMYIPLSLSPPTKHFDANATSYYSPPLSGNLADQTSGTGFPLETDAWLYVDGLDVVASPETRSIVAFGDSITDGWVAATPASFPVATSIANTNGRYPDDLQRRLDAAGIPISVVNAGISSNRLLTNAEPLFLGLSGIQRFKEDALDLAGVSGVLVLEGINDLGLPPDKTADQVIAGYEQLIAEAHLAGKKIWLGTLLPASNAVFDGVVTAPMSEIYRQQINAWIRTQKLADGVVDFDAALRDPPDPAILNAEYSGPDHLHPNLAGYQVMANTVDISMLASTTSTC
jgi:lysophospholipase L1-like esterase